MRLAEWRRVRQDEGGAPDDLHRPLTVFGRARLIEVVLSSALPGHLIQGRARVAPRAARPRWGRLLTLALFGLLGVAADARPALAQGCHFVDRPILGMALPRDLPFGLDAVLIKSDRADAQVVPRPCQGDVPDLSARALVAALPLDHNLVGSAHDRTTDRLIPRAPTGSSRLCSYRLDRPPRPTARPASQSDA